MMPNQPFPSNARDTPGTLCSPLFDTVNVFVAVSLKWANYESLALVIESSDNFKFILGYCIHCAEI
jgi:hypothetical protein